MGGGVAWGHRSGRCEGRHRGIPQVASACQFGEPDQRQVTDVERRDGRRSPARRHRRDRMSLQRILRPDKLIRYPGVVRDRPRSHLCRGRTALADCVYLLVLDRMPATFDRSSPVSFLHTLTAGKRYLSMSRKNVSNAWHRILTGWRFCGSAKRLALSRPLTVERLEHRHAPAVIHLHLPGQRHRGHGHECGRNRAAAYERQGDFFRKARFRLVGWPGLRTTACRRERRDRVGSQHDGGRVRHSSACFRRH